MKMRKIVAIVAAALMLFSILPISAMAADTNQADFGTLTANTSYGTRTTTNGWVAVNSAVLQGGSGNSPTFSFIGADNSTKAVCLNGKTSTVGQLTSPTLTGGISKLTFNYGHAFSDKNGVNITITITDANGATTVKDFTNTSVTQKMAYTFEWALDTEVTGNFTIVIKNNCPSNSTSNKDRVAIWNLTWESATAVAGCDHSSLTCGDTCSNCGTEFNHKYDNNCDTECNVEGCDFIREVGDHVYNNAYDVVCSECKGGAREVAPEVIVDAAYGLASGSSLPGSYTLTGVISSVDTAYNSTYGNVTVTMNVLDSEGNVIEGKPIQCFRLAGDGADEIGIGYTITVTGTLKNYNGTIEFDAACTLDSYSEPVCTKHEYTSDYDADCNNCGELRSVELPTDPAEIVDAIYTLAAGESFQENVTLSGVITEIDAEYNTDYENISVIIDVYDSEGNLIEGKPILCFRMKGDGADELVEGFIITVTGILKNHGGTVEFDAGCSLDSYEAPECEHTYDYDCSIVCNKCGEETRPEAEHEYFDACSAICLYCNEETREVSHNVIHVEAKDATCTAMGNLEFWYCDVCGMAWLDEACTMNTNMMAVKLPMAEHIYTDCLDEDCDDCGDVRTDIGHNLTYFEAVIANNCQETGNDEYWKCSECNACFSDAEASNQVNPAWIYFTGDHVRPEGAADCATVSCTVCHEEIPGEGEHDTGVAACQTGTCSKCNAEIEGYGCQNYDTPACEDGVCYYCGGFVAGFGHENGAWAACCDGECSYGCGKQYPATEDHVDADDDDYCDNCWNHLNHDVDPCVGGECSICWTYIEPAHTYFDDCSAICEVCGYEREVSHNVIHVEAAAPTCTDMGNLEYWYCDSCGMAWLDAECIMNTNLRSVTLPMAEHEYYYACDAHCKNCGEKTNPNAKHNVIHVEAVEATCTATGNIEYWYCDLCHTVWNDADLMRLTNMMSVKTFKDHEYFSDCDAHCMNCGEMTRPEAGHNVIHVEAVAPTCTAMGNLEFWYCDVCGMAWLDEACTMNTNMMAVKLPAAHTFTNDNDAMCNVEGCGEFRNIETVELTIFTFQGNSVSEYTEEIGYGLAFSFEMNLPGIAVNAGTNVANYDNASINGAKVIGVGAYVSNGNDTQKVPAVYLCDFGDANGAANDKAIFAVRVINIPDGCRDREITAWAYYELEGGIIIENSAAEVNTYNNAIPKTE